MTETRSTKIELKNLLEEACRLKDEKEIKESILRLEKQDIKKNDNCRRKEYIEKMTLSETRILFQHRAIITKNDGNFKNWGK